MTEALPFLDPIHKIPGVRATWIERFPEIPITGDRAEAMNQLRPLHEAAVKAFSPHAKSWWRAEQIHSAEVSTVPGASQILAPDGLPVVPHVDGLITSTPGIVLGIYVADCGAIWLADRKTGAIGLLHSGKKGTEGNILQNALHAMKRDFGTLPENVTAVLSPCIRPPYYEIDFAADIARQAEAAGLGEFLDCGLDTAADLRRFYSYRTELGKTGRMLALITRDS
ncbi:MAG: polyphenol oxidase family protein [Luteolibacter sp.]